MIPLADLKIRGVYVVDARNFKIGIWAGRAFVGRRHKFGWRLDGELYWEKEHSRGSALPTRFLCMMPPHVDYITLDTTLPIAPNIAGLNYALFGYLTHVEDAYASGLYDEEPVG
jgi:hypothetical protein